MPAFEEWRPKNLHICSISRDTELGRIGAQRSVTAFGEVGSPIFTWTKADLGRPAFHVSWFSGGASYVQITYHGLRPGRTYRMRTEGTGEGVMQLDSGRLKPNSSGQISIVTTWPLVMSMMTTYDIRFVLRGDDGSLVRGELLDPALFERARTMARALDRELTPVLVDYRNTCSLVRPYSLTLID